MSQTFVLNERTYSCCGQLVSNGKCNCKTGHTNQPAQRSSYIGRNAGTPEPMGINQVWNFSPADEQLEPADEQSVTNSDCPLLNTGGGLPHPDWETIFNQDAGQTRPVVKPVVRPPVTQPEPKKAGILNQPWIF